MHAQRAFMISLHVLLAAAAIEPAVAEDRICVPAQPEIPCRAEGGSYFARVPPDPEDWSLRRRFPMVLLLHDKGESPATLVNDTTLVESIVRRGYALVVPAGLNRSFADGEQSGWFLQNTNRVEARVLSRWEADRRSRGFGQEDLDAVLRREAEQVTIGRDEIAFLRNVIAAAASEFHLETPAAAIIGIGHGGSLAWETACSAPELAELFAPVDGGLIDGFPPACAGEVRLAYTGSGAEAGWPIDGAARVRLLGAPPDTDIRGRPILARRGPAFEDVNLMPIRATLDAFAAEHGCSAEPETVAEAGGTLSTWSGCAAPGTALTYWRLDGAFAPSGVWLDRVLGATGTAQSEGTATAAPRFLKARPEAKMRATPPPDQPGGAKFARPKAAQR